VSVLPDNVGWLRCRLNLNLLFAIEPLVEVSILIFVDTLNDFLEVKSSLKTFFELEGNENGDRSAPSIKVSLLHLVNLSINFAHLVPLIIDDVSTSLTEKTNQFRVVVGKGGDSNINVFLFLFFVTKVRKFAHSQFNLILDPNSKVFGMSLVLIPLELNLVVNLRIVNVAFTIQELLVERCRDIELDGVVTSGDGLDIPLYEVVGLNASDVVNINDHEKGDEHTNASVVKTENLSLLKMLFIVGTGSLDEKQGLLRRTFSRNAISTGRVSVRLHGVARQVLNVTLGCVIAFVD